MALLHPFVITTWYLSIDGSPGFTLESFEALRIPAQQQESTNGEKIYCNLTLDEMGIKKMIKFYGSKYHGYVDIGTGVSDDSMPPATEVLVLMVVAINGSWKILIGNFMIHKNRGEKRQICITCDGPSCNFAMFNALRPVFCPYNMEPTFPHPSNPEIKIAVILPNS
nr:uncharacterized protein LOC121113893 [Lepeophtheirus salmonis]